MTEFNPNAAWVEVRRSCDCIEVVVVHGGCIVDRRSVVARLDSTEIGRALSWALSAVEALKKGGDCVQVDWAPFHHGTGSHHVYASAENFKVHDLFELLRSTEVLKSLVEKLELQLSDEAVIGYLRACKDALDLADEDEKRILQDAIFVLESNWASKKITKG